MCMFRKAGITAALSATLLFGGAFVSDVEASANSSSNHSNYSINGEGWNEINNSNINQFRQGNFDCFDINGENAPTDQPEAAEESQPTGDANAAEANPAEEGKEEKEANADVSQFEQEVVDLTNQEREKQGLAPLELDPELSKVAREKSKDMQSNNYFDHNSPNYGSPFDMMQSFGIDYNTAGENIAQGQQTPEEVVNAWMNSQGHRENIMNSDFTHIGIGYVEQGNYWTQMFIGK